ncbi:MAG: 2-hydroxyacid dehydrogenase [Alphaproteobacteria bacterium]|nr:2-hydroxyacid dehydrogenase [Alphaproteobacteria bacterium]
MPMKPEIVVTGNISAPGTMAALEDAFTAHHLWKADDETRFLAPIAARIEGMAVGGHRPIDAALMDRLPKLKLIANFGVGVDSIDLAAAKSRGIAVTNTPDVLTEEVADLAIALLIDAARGISASDRYLRAGKWRGGDFPLQHGIRGKSMGILGLGRIGTAIAEHGAHFGMTVRWTGRRAKAGVPWTFVPSLVELARLSDFLVVACPGGAETFHLVTSEVLAALGREGTLVNIGRGSVVDEAALVDALKSGALGGAALDVFEHEPDVPEPLLAMANVVLVPHIGSATVETRAAMGQLMVDNLLAHFAGKPLLTRVV